MIRTLGSSPIKLAATAAFTRRQWRGLFLSYPLRRARPRPSGTLFFAPSRCGGLSWRKSLRKLNTVVCYRGRGAAPPRSGALAALTIATMVSFKASGRVGQAVMMAARSGGISEGGRCTPVAHDAGKLCLINDERCSTFVASGFDNSRSGVEICFEVSELC